MTLRKAIRRNKAVLLSITLVAALGWVVWGAFLNNKLYVPQAFTDAKQAIASLSEQIVGLSNKSSASLSDIKVLEEKGKYDDALAAINDEIAQVTNAKDMSVELLDKLSEMTQALQGVRPDDARRAGLEAVNNQINIANGLVAYNDNLQEILRLLTARVLYGEDVSSKLASAVDAANKAAQTIKDLSQSFNNAISRMESF